MTTATPYSNHQWLATSHRPAESPGGVLSNRLAGGTIIASTTSGAHFLRTYMPGCIVANCDGAGTVEMVSRLDNSARLFCLDHGLERLDALDYGKRGAK